MKKKLLSILLIGILVIGLTGCGNKSEQKNVSTNEKTSDTKIEKVQEDEGIELVKKYTEFISNGDVDSAVSLLDLDLLLESSNLKDKWTVNEVKESLKYFKEGNYKFSNIYKATSNEKETILKDIAGEYSYQAYMDKYSEYDFYVSDYSFGSDNSQKNTKKDIFYVNNKNGKLNIVNSLATESIITMYYIRVYSNPNNN